MSASMLLAGDAASVASGRAMLTVPNQGAVAQIAASDVRLANNPPARIAWPRVVNSSPLCPRGLGSPPSSCN